VYARPRNPLSSHFRHRRHSEKNMLTTRHSYLKCYLPQLEALKASLDALPAQRPNLFAFISDHLADMAACVIEYPRDQDLQIAEEKQWQDFYLSSKLRRKEEVSDDAWWAPWHELCDSAENRSKMNTWRANKCFVANVLWNLHQAAKSRSQAFSVNGKVYPLVDPPKDAIHLQRDLKTGIQAFMKDSNAIALHCFLEDGVVDPFDSETMVNTIESLVAGMIRDESKRSPFEETLNARLLSENELLADHTFLMAFYFDNKEYDKDSRIVLHKDEEILREDDS
jgi:hypothetical protein